MSKLLVILPGGFHPYHAGHYALYQSAKKAFPGADVYVAATNDTSERPFPFAIKEKLAKVAGVPPGRFVQVKSPFSSEEITSKYDPNDTVLIFVKSEKNAKNGSDPEGPFPAEVDPTTGKLPLVTRGPRKGQPVSDRLQYYKGNEKNLQPMSRHSYLAYLPTVEFGPGIKSGSELRNAWPKLDNRRKTAFVMSMYPATQKNEKLAANVVKMIDMGMGEQQGMAEGAPIVVMPRADRLKKPEPTKVRNQGDIVPPTKPPSTEKRGVKGRPGQRPMPNVDEGAEEALQYATKAHAGQTRAGGDPYITHPMRVADHIKQYKQSHNLDALISAAYLHDTVEDTDTTHEALHDLFGGLVASLVKELTSDPEQIKKMGKAQYLAHKMAAMSSYALVIKLADRLDNVKDITTARTPAWRQKYKNETEHILNYIEKTRALSGTHQKLIGLIRDKLSELDNPELKIESSGIPLPSTYEQETEPLKSHGARRIIAMTNEGINVSESLDYLEEK
jgi:hypothetical protein